MRNVTRRRRQTFQAFFCSSIRLLISGLVSNVSVLLIVCFTGSVELGAAEPSNGGIKLGQYLQKSGQILIAPNATKDSDLQKLRRPRFQRLETLVLDGTQVSDLGIPNLEQLPLRSLSLAATRVSDAGVAHLSMMRALRVVSLNKTAVTDQALALLARLELEEVFLNHTAITSDGCTALAPLPLHTFYAASTAIGDSCIKALRNKKIKRMNIADTNVSDLSVPQLTAMAPEALYIAGSRISHFGRQILKQAGIRLDKER